MSTTFPEMTVGEILRPDAVNRYIDPVNNLEKWREGTLENLADQDLGGYGLKSLALGTVSAPALSFTSDGNTGLFSPAADAVALATGGVERGRFDALGLTVSGLKLPSGAGAGKVLTSDADGVGTWQPAGSSLSGEPFVVTSASAALTNERVLTGTANQVILTDGGAGGALTLSLPQSIHTGATPRFATIGLGAAAHATNPITTAVGTTLAANGVWTVAPTLTSVATTFSVAPTWDQSATAFVGLSVNATNTASHANSLLARFGVGGAYSLTLTRDGELQHVAASNNVASFSTSQTWNSAGTTYAGIRADITDTASHADSNLLQLRVGGASRFRVQKDGTPYATSYQLNGGQMVVNGTAALGGNVTWNDVSGTLYGLLLNITDTHSHTSFPRLIKITRDGTSYLEMTKYGVLTAFTDTVTNSQTLWTFTGSYGYNPSTFHGLSVEITDTNSSANSTFLRVQKSGSDVFKVGKTTTTIGQPTAIQLGTITTNTPILSGTATWNAGGQTFVGMRLDVTDTASATASKLLDLQVGGTSKFWVRKDGGIFAAGDVEVDGNLDHDGSALGFFGATPAARAAAYTATNVTTDRTFDADSITVEELADVVGTLIADLRTYGLLQ